MFSNLKPQNWSGIPKPHAETKHKLSRAVHALREPFTLPGGGFTAIHGNSRSSG